MSTHDLRDSPPADDEKICPASLNLEYDRFDVSEIFSEPDSYPAPRTRRINRERITEAAQQFCPICTVLDEGMAAFWGDESWEAEEESEYSYDGCATDENGDDENDSEMNDGTNKKSAESLRDSDSDSKSNISGSSGNSDRRPNISIELRPGRTLFVRRFDLLLRSDLTDRLAGVALKIQEATNNKYLAGLWLQDLPRGLAWGNYPFFIKEGKYAKRLGGGIPSWSWMSLQRGPCLAVAYGLSDSFETDARVRINEEGTWCKAEGHQFGPVRSGQIDLEAASLAVTILVDDELSSGFTFIIPGDGDDGPRQFLPDCPCDPTEVLQHGESVLLLLLGTATLLKDLSIRLAVKPVEGMQGAYRRVGVVLDEVDILERGGPASRFILV